MNLAIDLDGCVVDWCNNLRDYLATKDIIVPDGGDHNDPNCTWTFYKDQWGLTGEEFFAHCDQAADEGFLFKKANAFPGALESLERLHQKGHTINIVTNRNFGTRSIHNTIDWLQDNNVHYDSITFASNKTIADCDLFIDDYEHNFDELFQAGKPCCLFDRPWNRHVDARDWRVSSWEDFEGMVENFAAWKDWGELDFRQYNLELAGFFS